MRAAQRLTKICFTLFAAACAVTAAVCVLDARAEAFTYKDVTYFTFSPPLLALSVLAMGALALFAARLWGRRVTRAPRFAAPALLAAYFAAALCFGFAMRVQLITNWDYGVVLDAAIRRVTAGTLPGEYFALFPNNAPLYLLLTAWLRGANALGVTDLVGATIVLSAAAVTASQGFLYLAARRMWGAKWALFALLAGMCTYGMLAYAPIAYTDTLSMPFPVAGAWLWLCARGALNEGRGRRGLALAAACGAVLAAGAFLKVTCAVALVAVCIDALLLLRGRAKLSAAAAAAAFAALYLLFGAAQAASPDLPALDKADSVPYEHWVMMGLSGVGGYDDDDYQLTLSADTYEARRQLARGEIARRASELGVSGMARHLADKLSYIFGDGTFYSGMKLRQAPEHLNLLHRLCLFEFRGFPLLAYPVTGLHLAGVLFAGVAALRRRKEALFLMLASLGLGMFLLLWEARSRYLVNFLPILILCAVCGLVSLRGVWYDIQIRRDKGAERSVRNNGRESEAAAGHDDGPRERSAADGEDSRRGGVGQGRRGEGEP